MKTPVRVKSRALWESVAAGKLDDPGTREWLQGVAANVLKADDIPATDDPDGKKRPAAIARAVGLMGRKQDTAMLRRAIRDLDAMSPAALVGRPDATDAEKQRTLRMLVCAIYGRPDISNGTPAQREKLNATIRNARRDGKE